MADTKISAMTAVTTPATADVLPIVSSGETKKVTLANLLIAGLAAGVNGNSSFGTAAGVAGTIVQIKDTTLGDVTAYGLKINLTATGLTGFNTLTGISSSITGSSGDTGGFMAPIDVSGVWGGAVDWSSQQFSNLSSSLISCSGGMSGVFKGITQSVIISSAAGVVAEIQNFRSQLSQSSTNNLTTYKGFTVIVPSGSTATTKIVNAYGLYIEDLSTVGTTNSYNIYSAGATAKNKFDGPIIAKDGLAIQFGGVTSSFPSLKRSSAKIQVRLADDSGFADVEVRQHYVDQTITAGGTTGNQTINKAAGTVNIAAAGTTVTVTNSLVTTNSTIHCVIRTNDATARIANVVPANGSFTVNLTAAATAEISIGFLVIN